jgi:GTP cyclohydrolase II
MRLEYYEITLRTSNTGTKQVAGIEDVRFQSMMPDALHWLGITRIDNFISMSDMKYNAIVNTGIKIVNRVPIPKELIPDDAHVEINAKVFAGYHAGKVYEGIDEKTLEKTMGRKSKDENKA